MWHRLLVFEILLKVVTLVTPDLTTRVRVKFLQSIFLLISHLRCQYKLFIVCDLHLIKVIHRSLTRPRVFMQLLNDWTSSICANERVWLWLFSFMHLLLLVYVLVYPIHHVEYLRITCLLFPYPWLLLWFFAWNIVYVDSAAALSNLLSHKLY